MGSEHFETEGGASAGRGVDPLEFAAKYGYGLPEEQLGRIQGEVEPGGKSKAQVLQAPVRSESLGSEQGHFEAVVSPIPRRRVDPEEFADKYGYGLPREHSGVIQVEPGGRSEHQSLLQPPLRESVGSELGPYETVGAPNGGRGMDPAEFADKYGYGLPQEHAGQIKVETLPHSTPQTRLETLDSKPSPLSQL